MRRSCPCPTLHFIAATVPSATATSAAVMSSRPPYRGFRGRGRRSYSDRAQREEQFVSGDKHFESVEDANRWFRRGGRGNFTGHNEFQPRQFRPPLRYNYNQQYNRCQPPPHYNQQPPPPHYNQQFQPSGSLNQNQQFRPPGQFYPNQQFANIRPFNQNQGFRPPHQFRPPPPKDLMRRNWEYAKIPPPENSEKFIILSYNLLADYLANDHRGKLYFHIPPFMMEWGWRKEKLLSELKWWSADILCFQEVDRFHELEEELKNWGYSGIWKMRTGNPIDGCAIFWRTSRFKLLHEECIEFNKLGMRDNVAQICVFELLLQNDSENMAPTPTSSHGGKRVVACNIHVLYNPKRGEIKIGQVRELLNRAYAVSKIHDGASVVLCGDFNCTPKSPLYNFILEQKLDTSEVHRDKVSGQASAEIRAYRPGNPRPRAISVAQDPPMAEERQINVQLNDSDINVQKQSHDPGVCADTDDISHAQNTNTESCASGRVIKDEGVLHDEATKISQLNEVESIKDETCLATRVQVDSFEVGSGCINYDEGIALEVNNEKVAHSAAPHPEDANYGATEAARRENVYVESLSDQIVTDEQSTSDIPNKGNSLDHDNSELHPVDNECSTNSKKDLELMDPSSIDTSPLDSVLSKKLENISISEPGEADGDEGDISEDDPEAESQLQSANEEIAPYDPSSWTPMEIETATGNAECRVVEHPLELKSTYTEVEACSGTRDLDGEPLATSYNRRFLGTVDYIWRSKGLQTVRVLGPIPKQAMQWTAGFPTKKWGSDHIALASELAFSEDMTNQKTEGL